MSNYQVTPAKESYATIQGVAEQLSILYHNEQSDDSTAIDLSLVLKKVNGDIQYGDGLESSYIDDDGKFHIFLPNMTSVRRDRFTIAHELGHYFFHYRLPQLHKQKGAREFGRGGRNKAETQANVFASSFLMPQEQFRTVFFKEKGDIQSIADEFQVSVAAANVRAQILGLKD